MLSFYISGNSDNVTILQNADVIGKFNLEKKQTKSERSSSFDDELAEAQHELTERYKATTKYTQTDHKSVNNCDNQIDVKVSVNEPNSVERVSTEQTNSKVESMNHELEFETRPASETNRDFVSTDHQELDEKLAGLVTCMYNLTGATALGNYPQGINITYLHMLSSVIKCMTIKDGQSI